MGPAAAGAGAFMMERVKAEESASGAGLQQSERSKDGEWDSIAG